VSTEGGIKAVIAALIASAGIAVSQFVAFSFTGSSTMLSEVFLVLLIPVTKYGC